MRRLAWIGMTVAIALSACGGEITAPPGGGAGGGAGGGTGGAGGAAELPPACADGVDTVLGMSRLLLGDTDRDGTANKSNGWEQYGVNLDGRITGQTATDVCKPAAGAAPSMATDGDAGIDNAFGKNILPMILGLDPAPTAGANQALAAGRFTMMLKIEQLGATTTCTAVTKLYGGLDLGAPPKFDGTDLWPVDPTLLDNPADIDSPKNVFMTSTIVDDAYRSGPEATFTLQIPLSGWVLELPIHHAVFEMALAPDRQGATIGTLAGVMDPEEVAESFLRALGTLDPSLCSGPTLDAIVNQIRQASDILKDGSQDPSATCDGISIGLGFEMAAVSLGPVGTAPPPPPDPCGPVP